MLKLTAIRKMILPILSMNIARKYKRKSSLIKINAARLYVLGVRKTRLFIMAGLVVVFSLLLLAFGMLLIHMALFSYSSWSFQTKFNVALAVGGAELLGALAILFYVFKEDHWAKFSGIDKVVNSVISNSQQKEKI